MRKDLNSVGCGMCLAKWTQVTMHLHLGHTHSCHHPSTHKIPLDELKVNPTALHNTQFKKERRKEMLDGKRPDECDYCWNVEDSSDRFSDRVLKSRSEWSYPHFKEIVKMNPQENYNPKYVEVSFSNACNFKCSYLTVVANYTFSRCSGCYFQACPLQDQCSRLRVRRPIRAMVPNAQ